MQANNLWTGRAADLRVGLLRSDEHGHEYHLAPLFLMSKVIEFRNPYTEGHSERVAEWGSELAAFVGDSATSVSQVYDAGRIHDIGKVGVPDLVLLKESRLTSEEQEVMQQHVIIGVEIVRVVPALEHLIPAVMHHHERFDGRGYPHGLSGRKIPRDARHLAVVDTFDAMTSTRPYREAMSEEAALREIAKLAGTQFDPDLAMAFVEMLYQRK